MGDEPQGRIQVEQIISLPYRVYTGGNSFNSKWIGRVRAMFRKWIFRTVSVFGLVTLSACVGTEQDMRYLNDQIVALNSRISGVEDTVHQRLEGTVEARLVEIKERQAETGQDLDGLKQEIRSLSGRVEEHRVLVQRAVERDTAEQESFRNRLSDLEESAVRLEESMTKVMTHLKMEPPPPPKPTVTPLPTPAPPAEPRPPEPSEDPVAEPVEPDEDLYNKSLALYRQGNFEEAISGFERLLTRYPDSRYAESAQFRIGECHMSLKQYEQAILAYQKVITEYPKGNRVAGATYRQAVAFNEINDKISARLLLNRVIRSFPQSEEAGLAKKKLEAIK